jgi:hypothetical protein
VYRHFELHVFFGSRSLEVLVLPKNIGYYELEDDQYLPTLLTKDHDITSKHMVCQFAIVESSRLEASLSYSLCFTCKLKIEKIRIHKLVVFFPRTDITLQLNPLSSWYYTF